MCGVWCECVCVVCECVDHDVVQCCNAAEVFKECSISMKSSIMHTQVHYDPTYVCRWLKEVEMYVCTIIKLNVNHILH